MEVSIPHGDETTSPVVIVARANLCIRRADFSLGTEQRGGVQRRKMFKETVGSVVVSRLIDVL